MKRSLVTIFARLRAHSIIPSGEGNSLLARRRCTMQRLFAATTPGATFAQRCRWAGTLLLILIVLYGISAAKLGPASLTSTPNDPYFNQQWYLNDSRPAQLHFQQAWDITTGSSNIVIAVIDTGVDSDHKDLSSKLVNGWDFVNNDSIPEDNNGHGTANAGIIGAETNNAKGIAGITWGGRIMPLKISDGTGTFDSETLDLMERAIRYAVQNGAKVINISMGGPCVSVAGLSLCSQEARDRVYAAIRDARSAGVVIVAASGNNEILRMGPPASFDEVISVGATSSNDERCAAEFGIFKSKNCGWFAESPWWDPLTAFSGSTYGNELDLVAPGSDDLVTTYKNNSLALGWGKTSAAAPQVSGLIALMLSVNPNLTPYQIQDILQRTAYKNTSKYRFLERIDEGGWNNEVGFGRIDAYRAVEAVAHPPSVQSIRILLKAVLERQMGTKDYSSQVAVIVQRPDLNHTRIWGPQIISTDSDGYSPEIIFNGLGPGTYDICAKPKYHLGMCKSVTLTVGQNPTVDFSDGGTQGAWPGDIDVHGEDNLVNGLDASTMTNYLLGGGLGAPGPYDFDRNGYVMGNDMAYLVGTRGYHPQGEGNFGRPFPHGVSGTAASTPDNNKVQVTGYSTTGQASLILSPSSGLYSVGDTFDVAVVLNTNGTETDATDALLRYDPGVLEVVDMDPDIAGIQVTMGNLYPAVSENIADPTVGIVRMGARNSNGTFNGTGTFATVRFRALASTSVVRTGMVIQFVENETIYSISAEHVTALNKLGSGGSALFSISGSPARPLPVVSLTPASNSYIALFNQPIEAIAQDSYGQVERVDFQAYYDSAWHDIASDTNGVDGWGITWDNLGIADQGVQLRAIAWLPGELNGSATNTNILLDRTAPAYDSSNFVPPSPSDASNVEVHVNASDNLAGVQRIELYVNSAPDGSTSDDWFFEGAAGTGNNAGIKWNTCGYTGTHQIAFAIKDYADNWSRWDSPGLPVITYTLQNPTLPCVKSVGQLGGPTYAAAVQGHYAYVGVGPRLVILDVTNPAAFKVVGQSAPLSGAVKSIVVSGTYAYVAYAYGGMGIINVSNPAVPTEVGFSNAAPLSWDIAVAGNYAYIADRTYGLRIINITTPASPTQVGFYDTPGRADGVAVVGNYAYVADGASGLRIINVSNPTNPSGVGFYDTPGSAYSVAVLDNYAYVADEGSGLRIINVSNPASPTEVGFYDTSGTAYGITVVGNYAYVADGWSGLHIIDVSNPASPTEIGFYNTPGIAFSTAVAGNYAYLAVAETGFLHIIDVSNPASPTEVSSYVTAIPGTLSGVAAADNYAYVADSNYGGLHIIDVSNPTSPTKVGFYDSPGRPEKVALAGNYAYVADRWSGLRIINVSNPASPTEVSFYDTPGDAQGVAVAGNYAYVADSPIWDGSQYVGGGLRIINIANLTNPTEVGFYDTPGFAIGVAVSGNYAYIADHSAGLRIINVSTPASPTEVGFYDTPGSAFGVAVAGNYAYVADGSSGLRIINVSNPASPTEVGFYDTPGSAANVVLASNYAYVADSSGLRVIDVSNPVSPTEISFYDTPGAANDVALDGHYVYIADWTGGLQILRFRGAVCYDFDGNRQVDVADIMQVASRWRCRCGDACYDSLYDIDGDCDTDIVDIMKVAAHWGDTCGGAAASLSPSPDRAKVGVSMQNPTVRLAPADSTVTAGSTFTVTVMIDEAVDLGAFQFDLHYSPASVQVEAITLGSFLASTGRTAASAGPGIDNGTGLASFAGFSFGTQPGPDGSGALALVRLRAVEAGTSLLDLDKVQVLDTQVNPQTPTVEDGSVTIEGEHKIHLPLILKVYHKQP